MTTLRLIIDPPRSATLNMAIDEMLMKRLTESGSPTLRFYGWDRPSVTVGYFQDVRRMAKVFDAERLNIPVVRRLAGGGAVLHGQDLTFSLCLPTQNPFFSPDIKSSYLKIHEAVRLGLQNDFPGIDTADCRLPVGRQGKDTVCFESPSCYDLLRDSKKILGSSQRRVGSALLHQATLFLNGSQEALILKIVQGFEKSWKVQFETIPLNEKELKDARGLEEERYTSEDWVFMRECSLLS